MEGKGATTAFIRCLPAVMMLVVVVFPGVDHEGADACSGSGRAIGHGESVEVNLSFNPNIDLVEGGETVYYNLTGEAGIFDIINSTAALDFRINVSGVFWISMGDDNVTVVIYPDYGGGGVLEIDPSDVIPADGSTILSLYARNTLNESDFAYVDITVTVEGINDLPALNAIHDQTVTQGFLSRIQLNGTDEETDWTDFTFTITNLTDGSPPDCISTYAAPDSKQYLCINATNDDVITRHIGLNITLFDEDGGVSWEVIDVLVLNSNDPPELPAVWPVETISEFDWMDFYGDYYFEIGPIDDPDLHVPGSTESFSYEAYYCGDGVEFDLLHDPVTGYYCWDREYGELVVEEIVDAINGTISAMVMVPIWDHHVAYNWDPEVFFVVYDAAGAEANITIDIDIAGVNDPVVIEPAEDINATMVNDFNVSQDETLVLGYYGFDMDAGSDLVWAFEITEMPDARGHYHEYGNALTMNITSPRPMGDYHETYDDDTHFFYEMMQSYYSVYGYDADFITVGYTEILFAPENLDAGELNLTLSLTDGAYTATENITITIHNVNDAPTAPTLHKPIGEVGGDTNRTAIEFENASLMVNLTGSGSNDIDSLVDYEHLTYTIDWGDGWTIEEVTPDVADTFVLQHTYNSEGEYYVNFSVEDMGGLRAWDGYWILVTAGIPPPPPVHELCTIDGVYVSPTLEDIMDPDIAMEVLDGTWGPRPGGNIWVYGFYSDDGYGDAVFVVYLIFYDKRGAEISRVVCDTSYGSFEVTTTIPKGTADYDVIGDDDGREVYPFNYYDMPAIKVSEPKEPPPPDHTGYYIMAAAIIVIIIAGALVLWSRPEKEEEGGDPWTQPYGAQTTAPSTTPTPRPLVLEPEFEGISGRGGTFRPRVDDEPPATNGEDAGPWEDQTASGEFVDDDWEGLKEEHEEVVVERRELIMDVEALPAATTPHPKKANGKDPGLMDEDEEDAASIRPVP